MKPPPAKLSTLKQELLFIVLFCILHVSASSADLPWALSHALVSWQVGASVSSFLALSACRTTAWVTAVMARVAKATGEGGPGMLKSLLVSCSLLPLWPKQITRQVQCQCGENHTRVWLQERNYCGHFFFIPPNTLFGADSVHLFIHSTASSELFGSKAYSGLKTKTEQTWSRVPGLAGGIRAHKGWQRWY